MYSWKVVCVGVDEDSEYDDCRAIHTIGKEVAHNLREKRVDMVASQITNENAAYHIVVDGEKIPLKAAKSETGMYVRTFDEDRSDDPLLDLQTIEEFELDARFGDI
jgi:hypothetical protein